MFGGGRGFYRKKNSKVFSSVALVCNGLIKTCEKRKLRNSPAVCPYCHRGQMALINSFGHAKYNLGNFVTSTPRFYEQLLLSESEVGQKIAEICGDDDINLFYLYLAIRNALRSLEIVALVMPRSASPFFEVSLLACESLSLPLLVIDRLSPPYVSLEIVSSDWSSLRLFSLPEDTEAALLRELMQDKRELIVEQIVNLAKLK